jgi:hypothetical protein
MSRIAAPVNARNASSRESLPVCSFSCAGGWRIDAGTAAAFQQTLRPLPVA